ncbi:MAG TPA: efflux RND transporter periplasmic adaptor subunit [Gemmataceae bacterium]|nr:efflux RND transporter periplasmic adaptor subunit [Gemmataceae bacterium]
MTTPSGPALQRTSTGWGALIKQVLSLAISLALTCTVLALLLWSPFGGPTDEGTAQVSPDAVQVTAPGELTIKPGSSIEKKITVATAINKTLNKGNEPVAPVLNVTGYVVARLGPGKNTTETRWDFQSTELAQAYSDWIKARADAVAAKEQLNKITALTDARVSAAKEVAERLRDLVKVGTDSLKDLRAAEADLRQATLQGQKDIFEAETNLANTDRARATLERQMYQAGMDPTLLGLTVDGTTIVVAEVPEARISLVTPGLACVAKFFAYKDEQFPAIVDTLSPSVSKEKRTLRVFFEVPDPKARLKPGMFAEIGLGTGPRDVLLVPGDAVLHIANGDYVLAGGDNATWRVVEVAVGETRGADVEIRQGLKPGDRVIGSGAILLKPLVVRALQN